MEDVFTQDEMIDIIGTTKVLRQRCHFRVDDGPGSPDSTSKVGRQAGRQAGG